MGQAAACPPRARVGRALSRAQLQAVARVRLHVSSLVRLPWDGSGGLKLNALHAELLREGRYEGGFSNEELQGPHVALSADRIKFGVGLEQFDPLPYLDPFTASTYIEPEILRGRAPPKQAPFPLQRNVSEVIKLAKRWDAVNRLRLYLASEVPKKRRSALTAVQKDELFDRLILDRRGPNAEEAHLARASQDLAPGWRLTDVELSPDQSLLLYSTDLCEMFFAFRISPERGATNCIAAEVELHHLSDTKAAKLFRRRFPRGPPQERVLMALFTEPMGDLNAVDYAQEAHGAVLQSGGSWLPEHRILGQQPLPRGDWLEMLTVDDHCGIALVPRSNPDGASPGRRLAEQSFSAAAAVYAKIPGLDVHPTKGLAGVSKGVLLGAEIDGEAGTVGAQQARRLALCRSTLLLVRQRRARGRTLRQLIGGWTYAACFQRHALSLFSEIYRALPDPKHDESYLDLDRSVVSELLAMSCLAPVLQTTIRAPVIPKLFCTDASPSGGGIVAASVSKNLASELWRRRALRGGHTRLATPTEAYFIEKGDTGAAAPAVKLDGPAGSLRVYFDVLDVCCGPSAPFTLACRDLDLLAGPRIDKQRNSFWDILDDGFFSWLMQLVAAGRVLYLHVGPPCTTFSLARKPALRSKRVPYGFDAKEPKTVEGNRLFLRCLTLLRLQFLAGHPGSLEHPATSLARYLPPMLRASGVWLDPVKLSMCQWGAPWRKDTHFHVVNAPFMSELGVCCAGGHDHVVLSGSNTSKAAEYPAALCRKWASLVQAHRRDLASDWPPPEPAKDPQRLESVWFNSLLRGGTFKELSRVHWRTRRHINLQEVAMLRALLRHVATHHGMDVRAVVGVDSLVTCGVCAKGRSASRALNAEWRKSIGYSVCCGVSPGLHYAPSRLNPSDPPSRQRNVEPPQARLPPWAAGSPSDLALLDAWGALPLQRKDLVRWVELTLRLCAVRRVTRWGYRGVRVGEASHPGPRKTQFPIESRPQVQLQYERDLTVPIKNRRTRLLLLFSSWLSEVHQRGLDEFYQLRVEEADQLLADFGQQAYDTGLSLSDFSETVNAVIDLQRSWRRSIQKAWDVARSWKTLAPALSHQPVPAIVLLAMQSLALLWGWWDLSGCLGLAFMGLLRPNELLKLTRQDLVLPEQAYNPPARLYINIPHSKTSARGARHQHVRIDDSVLIPFISALWTGAPCSHQLLGMSPYLFRKRWDQLLDFLGVPHSHGAGLTPAGLRAGGATFFFTELEDIEQVRWKGRWLSSRMLEIYLQETAALNILPQLTSDSRLRVARFAAASSKLIGAATRTLLLAASPAAAAGPANRANYPQAAQQALGGPSPQLGQLGCPSPP